MLVSELMQGIEGLVSEIEAISSQEKPKGYLSEEGWRAWHRERGNQARAMLRSLGKLKPFIYRIREEIGWVIAMHGHVWNVLDNLGDLEMVGGVSRSHSLKVFAEVIGLLSAYPEDAEIPLEGPIQLAKVPPIQEVMEAYLPHLHLVLQKASHLFLDGHYVEAAREACLGVLSQIRNLSGRTEDGIDLVNRVFSGKSPLLVLGDQSTEKGRNRQEGLGNSLRGFVSGLRNPTFHANEKMPAQEAFEWIVMASRYCRLLDECKPVQ
jgi:uncharacterized protein (TIGR02391 family)